MKGDQFILGQACNRISNHANILGHCLFSLVGLVRQMMTEARWKNVSIFSVVHGFNKAAKNLSQKATLSKLLGSERRIVNYITSRELF